MAFPVIMPKQGQSVENCTITKWYKKKGDKVNVGDLLFNYETDKASFDEEATVSGILLEIFFNEDDDVPVLTNVCVIGNPGENIDQFYPQKNDFVKTEIKKEDIKIETKQEKENIKLNENSSHQDEIIKISPRAKKIAEKIGVNFTHLKGSGPDGRIIEEDILSLNNNAKIGTFSSKEILSDKNIEGTGIGGRITVQDLEKNKKIVTDYQEIKQSNIRKIIAKAMHDSLLNSAQLTIHSSFDATDMLKFKINKDFNLNKITINDIILFSVSRTIINHKSINAHYFDDKMLVFKNCHLGVAVDTGRGLMVPTLFNANKKSLNEISKEIKYLIESCKKGSINPDMLKGGTFTITNLGTLGVEMFTPILNTPQIGILGINTITNKIKENKSNNKIKLYPAIGLSLTFDHRAIDGAEAAKFLLELKNNLENFSDFINAKESK